MDRPALQSWLTMGGEFSTNSTDNPHVSHHDLLSVMENFATS
eukprot:CAMPEP_0176062194 /NCGR_PEP_ID=MMETSP0120_2-20121206/31013_1 /TAXON_ID=160619 /ORGANISM="Kryptoperidinium foliaceum, Strain CCMP 1326" /LENGTH=41 /DNA_ID= /DNA_START= /DNA_END= /DNA_ORIENTATION=